MPLPDFELERYFAKYEFVAPYVLCASDLETMKLRDLVAMFDDECRALWEDLSLGYWPATGHPLLRREIAALYGLDADDVVVFTGAGEAIYIAMSTLLGPGDHAVVTWPGYQSLYEVARGAGADVTLWRLSAEKSWTLDPDELRAAIRPNTKLVVINVPHNPTGALCDEATFRSILDITERAGARLFSDEVYRFLEFDERDRLPPAAASSSRALSLGVMSKAFGLAGLRVGWIAARDRALLERFAAHKDYLSICGGPPNEVLALGALRNRDIILADKRAILSKNIALLDAFFERQRSKVQWVRPRAGSIGFPRSLSATPIEVMARQLVDEAGVMILPGSVYGAPGNHFRLGFGRSNLQDALGRFEAFLERR